MCMSRVFYFFIYYCTLSTYMWVFAFFLYANPDLNLIYPYGEQDLPIRRAGFSDNKEWTQTLEPEPNLNPDSDPGKNANSNPDPNANPKWWGRTSDPDPKTNPDAISDPNTSPNPNWWGHTWDPDPNANPNSGPNPSLVVGVGVGQLVAWLVVCVGVGRLVGWLVGCLVGWSPSSLFTFHLFPLRP